MSTETDVAMPECVLPMSWEAEQPIGGEMSSEVAATVSVCVASMGSDAEQPIERKTT